LGKEDLLNFYEQMLLDMLDPLIRTAREMDMGPELISAVVSDHIRIFRALFQTTSSPPVQNDEPTVEQFTNFVDWLHAATRFDYALTAVFLVLEKSIAEPTINDKRELLVTCKAALHDLGLATSKIFIHQPLQHVLEYLESPHIEVEVASNGIQIVREPRNSQSREEPRLESPSRQMEMSWLVRHKDLSECYRGQWIVLEGDQLIANDVDYLKAREAATQKGIQHPFIFFVPGRETGAFMGV
jgi:hypothetical protein